MTVQRAMLDRCLSRSDKLSRCRQASCSRVSVESVRVASDAKEPGGRGEREKGQQLGADWMIYATKCDGVLSVVVVVL